MQIAEHYAPHPVAIDWQIDNESGERCYGPVCARRFWAWLAQCFKRAPVELRQFICWLL
jgi:beta-galactosidase GanA